MTYQDIFQAITKSDDKFKDRKIDGFCIGDFGSMDKRMSACIVDANAIYNLDDDEVIQIRYSIVKCFYQIYGG